MERRSFLRNTAAAGLGSLAGFGIPSKAEGTTSEQGATRGGLPPFEITTGFEGGSLGKIVRVTDTYVRCLLVGEVDQDGRNRQITWFYLRIGGPSGLELTIDLTNLVGEYNYHPGTIGITPETPPVYSYDGRNWRHVAKKAWAAVGSSVRLRMKPARSRLWIAHVAPYTNRHLARLLDPIKGAPEVEYKMIGKSVQGRDIPLLTITDPTKGQKSKKVVWLMFRQHSWEAGSSWVGEGAVRFLLSSDPSAAQIRRDTIFKILPMQDPDGVFRGGVRFNCYGYDLNRNWDITDPVKMPEITAARNAIFDWVDRGGRIDFFLSLHNTQTGEYLAGPPSWKFHDLGSRVFEELTQTTTFDPSHSFQESPAGSTPPAPGRMDVVQGLYYKRSIPAFLMEQRIAYGGKLGRLPTVNDRLEFGKGLVKAIWTALT